jgi:hypothetical protein
LLIEQLPDDDAEMDEWRKLQYTPEERARMFIGARPFDLAAWLAEAPPATPEELQEMGELLQLRELERQESLAREAGLTDELDRVG